jgi:hypothetical protein
MSFKFHIVVHGILIVALNQKQNSDGSVSDDSNMEIVIPYDSCHCFMAACMDEKGSVIWQSDLPNRRLSITGVQAANQSYTQPDPNLLLCKLKNPGHYGPNTWCTVAGLPIPKIEPLRRFCANILDKNRNTYKNDQLKNVDDAGVPSAYALQFGTQLGSILFDVGTDLKRVIPGEDEIARLHIYAEGPTDINHDALLSLRHCVNDLNFDLDVSKVTASAPPDLNPPHLKRWEEDTLSEHQQIQITHVPPCFCMYKSSVTKGKKIKGTNKGSVDFDGSPRTCIPIVGTN